MAAKRGKKQARRKGESSIPGVAWLLTGLLIGGAVAVGVWIKMPHAVDGLVPKPNPAAKPPAASSSAHDVPEGNPPAVASAAASPAAVAPKKPKYDFYTLLPEREVVIPDEELTKQVKAEAAANLAAKQQAALAADAASADKSTLAAASTINPPASASAGIEKSSTPPAATTASANAIASTVTTAVPATAPAASAVTAAIPVPASQLRSGQYLLQAGAFRNDRQADDLKARIAMLGLVGRVETVQTAAGTMHRVRLGPYASASALEAAKQKLSAGGLPAVAIRVK